jgi:hypothetical protein
VKTGIWSVKLKQISAYLSGQNCSSAFVAIAMPDEIDRAADGTTVSRYLAAMPALGRFLCGQTMPRTAR